MKTRKEAYNELMSIHDRLKSVITQGLAPRQELHLTGDEIDKLQQAVNLVADACRAFERARQWD